MEITKFTSSDMAVFYEKERRLFRGSFYGAPGLLKKGLRPEFEAALRAGPEEAIQHLLSANPYLLQYAIPQSGHHGVWVFPKRLIRTKKVDSTPGLIPDYLVVARSSLRFSWHIIELKRYDTQFANANGTSLSKAGIHAVVQCATYHAHFQQYIETVRSNVGVDEIIQPEGVIVLIGDSTTETPAQRRIRDEFSQLAPKVSIASYDRVRRGLANDQRE